MFNIVKHMYVIAYEYQWKKLISDEYILLYNIQHNIFTYLYLVNKTDGFVLFKMKHNMKLVHNMKILRYNKWYMVKSNLIWKKN